MKLLAIDTATEQCSVALAVDGALITRLVPTARNHADMILPMVDAVLDEAKLKLSALDGLAFGRGPGSFTGVRIAVGVIQGLAYASGLPVAGVSNLAAVAQQAAEKYSLPTGALILVCMDARMNEVYWAIYRVGPVVELVSEERVAAPESVSIYDNQIAIGVGTGWAAYPVLQARFPNLKIDAAMLPRATEIARLGEAALQAGLGVRADQAQPVYLRDDVARPSVTA
jgi:tRNA threonylcarbamoyladenosine biosynthesis protein TsaB